MDKELQSVLGTIIEKIEGIDNRLEIIDNKLEVVDNRLDSIDNRLDEHDQKIDDLTSIMLRFENDMSRRVESLFDGYKLTHEKQWELERKMDEFERRLIAVEAKGA